MNMGRTRSQARSQQLVACSNDMEITQRIKKTRQTGNELDGRMKIQVRNLQTRTARNRDDWKKYINC